jgi:ABC-type amino acid transport substrate-binding protein
MQMRALALLVLTLPVAAAAAPAGVDLPDIVARGGRLRVIFARDTMPEAITLQADTPPGLEREMIEGFAALQRITIDYVVVPGGAERVPALLAGKGDVIVGAFGITDERRKQVDFTTEVFPSRHVVVTHRPHGRIDTVEALRRVRVGTIKTSSWAEEIANAGVPRENIDESFVTVDDLVAALRAGKVGAIVMGTGWALLEVKKDPQLELGLVLGSSVGRAWAVRKDAPQLLKTLDDYVTNTRRTTTWNRLVIKYYGEMALEVLRKAREQ